MERRCARCATHDCAAPRSFQTLKRLFALKVLLLALAVLNLLSEAVPATAQDVSTARARRWRRKPHGTQLDIRVRNQLIGAFPPPSRHRVRTDSASSDESATTDADILELWVPFEGSMNIDSNQNRPMLYQFRSTQNLNDFLVPLLISVIQPHYREAKFLKNQQQCYLKYSPKLLDTVYDFFSKTETRQRDIQQIAVHPDVEMVTFILDFPDLYIGLHCPGLGPVFHNQFLLSQKGIYSNPEWKVRVYPTDTFTLYSPDGKDYPILPFRLMSKNVLKQFPKIFKYNQQVKTVFKGLDPRQANTILYTQLRIGYDTATVTGTHAAAGNLLLSIPETFRNPAYTSYIQTVAYFASGVKTKPMPISVNARNASPVSGAMRVFEYNPSLQQTHLTQWLFAHRTQNHLMTLFFSTGSGISRFFKTASTTCQTRVTAVTFHEEGCARVAARGQCFEKDLEFFTLRYDKKDPPPDMLQWHNEVVLAKPLKLKITLDHGTVPWRQPVAVAEVASETQQRSISVLFTNQGWRNWKFALKKKENSVTILPGQESSLDQLNTPTILSDEDGATKSISANAQFVLRYIDIVKGLRTGTFRIARNDASTEPMISVAFAFSRPFPCEMQTGLHLKSNIVTAKVFSKRGSPQHLLLNEIKIPIASYVKTTKKWHLPADIVY